MEPEVKVVFRRGLLIGALALAIAVQVFEFAAIDDELGRNYAAHLAPADPDLLVAASEVTSTIRERFALYAEIGRTSPGAEVLLGPGASLSTEQLLGLSRAGSVRPLDDPIDLPPGLAVELREQAATTGELRGAGTYRLVADANTDRLVSLRDGEELLVVDATLLPAFDQ